MALWKCNACNGTYSDTTKDGTVYFHVCPMTPPNAQGVQQETANRRDENIALDRQGRFNGIVARGAGVTPMQGQSGSDPSWLVGLQSQPAQAQ